MVNFDYVIMIIFFFGIIIGMSRGVFKEIKNLAIISLSVCTFAFGKDLIISQLDKISFFNNAINSLYKFFKNIMNISAPEFYNYLVFILILLAFTIILSLLSLPFKGGVRSIIQSKKKSSRLIGAVLGIINAYFIVIVVVFLLLPFVKSEETVIYKNFMMLTNKFFSQILAW